MLSGMSCAHYSVYRCPDYEPSFTCEHTFCKACTSKLAPGYAESVSCPSCRKEVPKEDMETVEYTASQQWDALLDVARKWARIDHRREMETSDEEAEEQFIDDDNDASEARCVRSLRPVVRFSLHRSGPYPPRRKPSSPRSPTRPLHLRFLAKDGSNGELLPELQGQAVCILRRTAPVLR